MTNAPAMVELAGQLPKFQAQGTRRIAGSFVA